MTFGLRKSIKISWHWPGDGGEGWQVVGTTFWAEEQFEQRPKGVDSLAQPRSQGPQGSKAWRCHREEGGEEARYRCASKPLPVSAILQGPQWREP